VLFVRHIAVPAGPLTADEARFDHEAIALEAESKALAMRHGIPVRFLYATAMDVGETVLDIAVTHGVDMLVLGTSRRSGLWRTMKGDVLQSVADQLPASIELVVHA
jgi:nucleotide-binding universal stress UspA family protein